MTQRLVSKKELRTVYGVPYSFAHIARLEMEDQFPKKGTARHLQGGVVVRRGVGLDRRARCAPQHDYSFLKDESLRVQPEALLA